MVSDNTIEQWNCPNCGFSNETPLLNDKVCERCGWSDVEPEDDNKGYE